MTGHVCLFLSRGRGLADWHREGLYDREVEVYRRLARRGWRVTIVGYDAAPPAAVASDDWYALYTQWPFGALRGRLGELYEVVQPYRYRALGRQRPVVVTNQASMGGGAWRAARQWQAPLVARGGFVFGVRVADGERRDARAVRRRQLERTIMAGAEATVCPTPSLRQWVETHYGVAHDRAFVVPNHVDTDLFTPAATDASEPGRIIAVGRLTAVKRLELLVRALAGSDYVLEVIGAGEQREAVAAEAGRLGVRVDFAGVVPNSALPERLRRARVYAITSSIEGHPKALIEAMACGRACVGTAVPGIVDVITDGDTGLLVEADPTVLRRAIDRVMTDADLRGRLERRARAFAVASYSTEQVTTLFENVLDFAMERSGP